MGQGHLVTVARLWSSVLRWAGWVLQVRSPEEDTQAEELPWWRSESEGMGRAVHGSSEREWVQLSRVQVTILKMSK